MFARLSAKTLKKLGVLLTSYMCYLFLATNGAFYATEKKYLNEPIYFFNRINSDSFLSVPNKIFSKLICRRNKTAQY